MRADPAADNFRSQGWNSLLDGMVCFDVCELRNGQLPDGRQSVEFDAHHAAYEERDAAARRRMRELIADPKFNRLERLFSDVLREGGQ